MHLISEQAEPAHPLRHGNAAAIRGLLMQRAEGVQVAYHGERFGVRDTRLLTAMAPVLAWMEEHLDQDQPVRQLARHAAMSERTFARRFVAETGTTPA